MITAGWLYLAANHVNEEARRVSQAYVLDSLSGVPCGLALLHILNPAPTNTESLHNPTPYCTPGEHTS